MMITHTDAMDGYMGRMEAAAQVEVMARVTLFDADVILCYWCVSVHYDGSSMVEIHLNI